MTLGFKCQSPGLSLLGARPQLSPVRRTGRRCGQGCSGCSQCSPAGRHKTTNTPHQSFPEGLNQHISGNPNIPVHLPAKARGNRTQRTKGVSRAHNWTLRTDILASPFSPRTLVHAWTRRIPRSFQTLNLKNSKTITSSTASDQRCGKRRRLR